MGFARLSSKAEIKTWLRIWLIQYIDRYQTVKGVYYSITEFKSCAITDRKHLSIKRIKVNWSPKFGGCFLSFSVYKVCRSEV